MILCLEGFDTRRDDGPKFHCYDNPARLLADLNDQVIGPVEAEVAKLRSQPALQSALRLMRFRRPNVFMGREFRPPEYDRPDTSVGLVRALMAEAGAGTVAAAGAPRL
jgi:hypothetical protein